MVQRDKVLTPAELVLETRGKDISGPSDVKKLGRAAKFFRQKEQEEKGKHTHISCHLWRDWHVQKYSHISLQ